MGELRRPYAQRAAGGLVAMGLVAGLAGCSSLDFWGSDEDRLPGNRISVLGDNRSVSPDVGVNTGEINLPGPVRNQSWPQNGGNETHVMNHLVLSGSPRAAWSKNLGQGSGRATSPPVIQGNQAYAISAGGRVSAISLNSGDLMWSTDLASGTDDDDLFGGGLAISGGTLYATTGFGQIFALNASNGAVLWQKRAPAPVRSAPTFYQNTLFITSTDNRLMALSANSGDTLWEFETGARSAGLLGGASPAITGDTVVVAFSNGELVGLEIATGLRKWGVFLTQATGASPVDKIADIRGNPAIVDTTAYAVSNSGIMAGVDLKTGQQTWNREVASMENPWVAGDFIYVVTRAGEVVCVSRKTGRIYWVKGLPRFEDPEDKDDPIFYTGPVLASNNLILLSSDGKGYLLSPRDGSVTGNFSIGRGAVVPPVIANGIMLVLTTDGTLTAYR